MKNTKYSIINSDREIGDEYISEYIRLYRDAYGNDKTRKEGMVDPKTGKTITFDDYEALKRFGIDTSEFKECYPVEAVKEMLDVFALKPNRLDIALEEENTDKIYFNQRESLTIQKYDIDEKIRELEKNRNNIPDYNAQLKKLLFGRMQVENIFKIGAGKIYSIASGYDDTLSQLNKEKFKLDDDDFIQLLKKIQMNKEQTVNYLAELFVETDKQGYGFGMCALKGYLNAQTGPILTRTTQLKPNPYKMFEKLGFKKIYDYPESDERKRGLRFLEK